MRAGEKNSAKSIGTVHSAKRVVGYDTSTGNGCAQGAEGRGWEFLGEYVRGVSTTVQYYEGVERREGGMGEALLKFGGYTEREHTHTRRQR